MTIRRQALQRRAPRGFARQAGLALLIGLPLLGPVLALANGGAAPSGVGVSAIALRNSFGTAGDAIVEPLHGLRGDARRGRALVVDRRVGLCLLCHSGPFPEERTPGDLSTDLTGVGSRWSEGQLRLRIVDARRLNPDTIMPAYHRVDGLHRVGEAWRDRPLFTAQQVEDVVAFLVTLK